VGGDLIYADRSGPLAFTPNRVFKPPYPRMRLTHCRNPSTEKPASKVKLALSAEAPTYGMEI